MGHAYDPAGRRTATTYSDDTANVSYSYDAAGRVTTVVDGAGTASYIYDATGKVTEVDRDGTTVGYGYDNGGQLIDLVYPTGQAVEYTYDSAGQMTKVADWAGREFSFDWSADGDLVEIDYPNDAVTTYSHDAAGQVLGIDTLSGAAESILDLGYSYTDAGLLASQEAVRASGSRAAPASTTSLEYTWDEQSRVETIGGDVIGSIGFDLAGSVAELEDGRELTYDSARQLVGVSEPGGASTTYGYDARGNRTTSTTGVEEATYTWDLADRMMTSTLADGTAVEYTYDASGLRSSARVDYGDTVSSEDFVWDTTAEVPLLLADGSHQFIYGPGSVPLAQVDFSTGSVDFLHSDVIGSVRTTTNGAGSVTGDADYDTHGTPALSDGPAVSDVTRFGFAGEYTDVVTGLVYLRARYLDPFSAQFLNRDPLEDTTRNPYGYTDGNPLQFTDPLGLDWWNPASWSADALDTASLVLGGVTLALTATGVGAPLAVATGVLAAAAATGAGAKRASEGDYAGMALSLVGVVPGVGGLVGKGGRALVQGAVAARTSGAIPRSTGALFNRIRTWSDFSGLPTWAGGNAIHNSLLWQNGRFDFDDC